MDRKESSEFQDLVELLVVVELVLAELDDELVAEDSLEELVSADFFSDFDESLGWRAWLEPRESLW